MTMIEFRSVIGGGCEGLIRCYHGVEFVACLLSSPKSVLSDKTWREGRINPSRVKMCSLSLDAGSRGSAFERPRW